jgi:hypothetical protein
MILAALLIPALLGAHAGEQDSLLVLQNSRVKLEVQRVDGEWREAYFARNDAGWQLLLHSGNSRRAGTSLSCNGEFRNAAFDHAASTRLTGGGKAVLLEDSRSGLRISKRITLEGEAGRFALDVSATITGHADLSHLLSTYTFAPGNATSPAAAFPDFVFTPQLRPEQDDVIGDHVFRAPGLMLQRDASFVALVPDLAAINVENRRVKTAADVRVDSSAMPMLSYGLMPYAVRSHVFYRHTDSMSVSLADTTVRYGYTLLLDAKAPAHTGYREALRFLWTEYGSKSLQVPESPQTEPFASYIAKAWQEFVSQVALDIVFNGTPVTLLRQGRLAWSNGMPSVANNDAWFNVWFNSLRTAYGMFLYGQMSRDLDLVQRAVRVLNLALIAPIDRGIAPTIFYVDSIGGHWVADHAWGGIRNGSCLPMFHNAWTCYWLLQWSDLMPKKQTDILEYTGRFADFLCSKQQQSGVIPSWYLPETLEPAPELRDENAETAGAALFLAEAARRTGNVRYREAAVNAMRYIFDDVVPENKWFDFETFFSCSRKPLGFFDTFTHQHPQNTLSMHQAAEACLVLHTLTGDAMYLRRGEEILDYLCLYQQVWSPRWLSCRLFGGFGVQNTDGEWSDSRQAYIAVTLMRYFQATGHREYLERAVAAARAQFSLFESPGSPRTAENYAHGGVDRRAGVTGLHWGTGSAVVSLQIIMQEFGGAYVDVKHGWGVGIDGCTIESVSVDHETIAIAMRDDLETPHKIRLVCAGMDCKQYTVVINGRRTGTHTSASLANGIIVRAS